MTNSHVTKCSPTLIILLGKSKSKSQWRIAMLNFDYWLNWFEKYRQMVKHTSGCVWKGFYRHHWQVERQLERKTHPGYVLHCSIGWGLDEIKEDGRESHPSEPCPSSWASEYCCSQHWPSHARLFGFHYRLKWLYGSFQAYSFGLRLHHLYLSCGSI